MADGWSIQVPLSDLVALASLPSQMADLQKENVQLRRELNAVRSMLSETIELIGDLRRDIRKQ